MFRSLCLARSRRAILESAGVKSNQKAIKSISDSPEFRARTYVYTGSMPWRHRAMRQRKKRERERRARVETLHAAERAWVYSLP